MDLKEYYREVAKIETSIKTPFAVIVSLPTANGGREGLVSEVARTVAARMVADKQARLADAKEIKAYQRDRESELKRRDDAVARERIRTALAVEDELTLLKEALQLQPKGR